MATQHDRTVETGNEAEHRPFNRRLDFDQHHVNLAKKHDAVASLNGLARKIALEALEIYLVVTRQGNTLRSDVAVDRTLDSLSQKERQRTGAIVVARRAVKTALTQTHRDATFMEATEPAFAWALHRMPGPRTSPCGVSLFSKCVSHKNTP